MKFRAVEAAEWDKLHSVDGYAKQIRERATLLLEHWQSSIRKAKAAKIME